MNKKRKNKGFSLVELLAVIVILGLLAAFGLTTISTLIDKSKEEEMESNKNTVNMSAQTYLQNNKNLVPKVIGETKNIKISELRSNNYLTEDIKNSKGESCMENSYVRVYKLSNTEYTYTTYLYCGNEQIPEEEDVPSPLVTAKFSDSTGDIKDEKLNNVSDAYLHIEISAATEAEIQTYKNQGTDIQIDGYSFKIFVVKDGVRQESYNSGSLSAGRQEKILINKKLKDYIDVTGVTEVSLEVTAINTIGGITNTNTTVGEHGNVGSTQYNDTVKPKCVKPDSPYTEGDWLNKDEYKLSKEARKLTVGCDDGMGSQCIRNYFTVSWPNDDDKYGAEYVYVTVKDNAGNESEKDDECKFRVNVDIQTPSATVTAYVGAQSNANDTNTLSTKTTGGNILKKTVKASDSATTAKINPTDEFYTGLIGNNTNDKWMNNANFPNGVVYKIDVTDNIRIDKWTWNTNAGYIESTKANNYLKVSGSNPEASSGNFPQDAAHGKTEFHGSTNDTIYVRFLTEGMRYGVLTIYDKAGNSIKFEIAAHLDRTAPPVPNNMNAYVYNKVRTEGTSPSSTSYSFSTWSNRYVRVETSAGQNRDNLSNNVTLSGFWQYYYFAKNNANNRVGTSDYRTYSSGVGYYDFKGSAASVDGKNKIQFMGCDKANNCSAWSNERQVWIDITIPTCTVTKHLHNSESSYGWLGIGESATVKATCNDPTSTLASGCTLGSFEHLYNYQINTQTAGAKGNSKAGSFADNAGNTVNCVANQRIQIDYQAPTCAVSGGSSSWTNKSRTVTGTCSDTGGSGCVGNISHTYNYDISTTSGGAAGNGNGGSVRDKADNVVSCRANQTVKVDRTMPYVTVDKAPGTYNSNEDILVTITCHDALSGLSSKFEKSFSAYMYAPTTGMNIAKCCTDNAGNEMCDLRGLYKIKIYGRHSSCGIESYNSCRTSGCGVELYKSCRNSACGVAQYKSCQHSSCGTKTSYGTGLRSRGGGSCSSINGSWLNGKKYTNCTRTTSSLDDCTCTTSWSTTKTCRTAGCGVESYNSCRTSGCGVESYKYCTHSQCGVKYHAQCWHFEANCRDCPHASVK